MDKGKVLNGFNTEVKTDLSPYSFLSFNMTVFYFCLVMMHPIETGSSPNKYLKQVSPSCRT